MKIIKTDEIIGEEEFIREIKQITHDNIGFIASRGVIKHDDSSYITKDIGKYEDSQDNYVEVIDLEKRKPIYSIIFDVKDNIFNVKECRVLK